VPPGFLDSITTGGSNANKEYPAWFVRLTRDGTIAVRQSAEIHALVLQGHERRYYVHRKALSHKSVVNPNLQRVEAKADGDRITIDTQ
jgi:hypothetical protein